MNVIIGGRDFVTSLLPGQPQPWPLFQARPHISGPDSVAQCGDSLRPENIVTMRQTWQLEHRHQK